MPRPSRRAEIVQAAAEEFRGRGYDAATLEGIAARVGILKGSLYHYVDSKEELLFAVIERPAHRLLAELRALVAVEASAVVRLRTLFRIQVAIFAEHYPAAFVYLSHIGHASHRPDFKAMDAEYMAAVTELVAAGVRDGEYRLPTTPDVAARAIVGQLDWMQHWFRPRDPASDRDLADRLFALALGGLASGAAMHAALRAEGPALDAVELAVVEAPLPVAPR